MADYTQTTFFGPKDALASGNPLKLIKGTEFDTEFSAIQTSILSKYDSDDVANNAEADAAASDAKLMTPLKVKRLIENATYSGVAKLALANNFTAAQRITITGVQLKFVPASDSVESFAQWYQSNGTTARAWTGFGSAPNTFHIVNEMSGGAIALATSGGGALTFNGNTVWHSGNDGSGSGLDADTLDGQSSAAFSLITHTHSGADITSGTVAAARISALDESTTVGGSTVGLRDVPRRTSGFGRGECLAVSAGVTLNTSDMAAGRCFSVYNESGSDITITQGAGVTLRLGGTASSGSRVLAARGICTIWCNSGTEAIATGHVS
jgi:hypothetical protein